jgi:hypothetical protein
MNTSLREFAGIHLNNLQVHASGISIGTAPDPW